MATKSRAFTLMELLVVIAIIALLMSIMMPSLSRVKHLARLVVCGSNQHQITVAVMTYNSSNGELPPSIQGYDTPTGGKVWGFPEWLSYHSANDPIRNDGMGGGSVGRQLSPYIQDVAVWFCPMCKYDQNYAGSTRTMQERYLYGTGGPDGDWGWPAGALKTTNLLLWNYQGFNQDGITFNGTSSKFAGPGKKSSNTLILAEQFWWGLENGIPPAKWFSCHPFDGSARGGGMRGDSWWVLNDAAGEDVPDLKYPFNAGYLDGSVRRYKLDDCVSVNLNGYYYLPADWK